MPHTNAILGRYFFSIMISKHLNLKPIFFLNKNEREKYTTMHGFKVYAFPEIMFFLKKGP